MGNYCDPYDENLVINTQRKDNVLKESDLKSDSAGTTNNHSKNLTGNLKSGNPGKLEKTTSTGNVDQEDKTDEKQQGSNKTVVEQSENKPCETENPVDEQKQIVIACSQKSKQSEGAQIEKPKEVNQDVEENVVVLEYVIPQEKNNITVQNTTTIGVNPNTQKEISSPISVEPENKHIAKDIGRTNETGRSCLESENLAEKKTAVEHNETAEENSTQVAPSEGNMENKKGNLQEHSQLEEEAEFRRLENEISEKKKIVAKHNETLARISKQKAERAKDLESLENRVGIIKLQNELKERAYIVGSMGNEEKSSKMVTLNEGKLFKFGRGGLTYPKEKWVQLRQYSTGHVVLDYAELLLSAKLERNQIISVEHGEKYLSGESSPYKGRVFAVRTTSTGKHRHMVFAVESKELCGEWIECIKRAFNSI